jgi:hypothetical protein
VTAPDWIGALLAGGLAIWESRHSTGAVANRLAGLGGNLGPRVSALEQRVAWLEGAAGIKAPQTEADGGGR